MRALIAVVVTSASCLVGGCVFEPVPLEGRACSTDTDCITGYACTDRICVIVPDAGRPDAGRPDAVVPDVGRDAPFDAPLEPDADLDAAPEADAGSDAGEDGGSVIFDDVTLDAFVDDAAIDAAATDDAP